VSLLGGLPLRLKKRRSPLGHSLPGTPATPQNPAHCYVIPSLDSPPARQHNAYTFFAGPRNCAFSRESARKRGTHVDRLKGTVKWFNNAKGYGFLGRDEGPDVFIHYSSISSEGYKSLQEGDQVEFEIVQGQKGPQAANVTKVS